MEPAFEVGGVDFAAGQSHGFKNTFVAKCRLLIGLFFSGRSVARAFSARILVRLRHRKLARTRTAAFTSDDTQTG